MTNSPGGGQPPYDDQPSSQPPAQPPSGWTTPPAPEQPAYGQQPPPYYGQPQPPGQTYGQPPYGGQPPAGYPGPQPYRLPDHPDATKALIVGIISLLGGLTCWLPMVLGPWAWILGRRVVSEIDANPGRWEGRNSAMTGYVLGVVSTVLLALGLVALIGMIVIFVVAGITASSSTSGATF